MPQLVKGGKYVFGWSIISEDGWILIPEEAIHEYKIKLMERVILIPGSNTSGGFSIVRKSLLARSRLSDILTLNPDLAEFRTGEGEIVSIGGRKLCWVTVREKGQLLLITDILEAYGIKPNDYLLSVRGSYIGIGMAVKGSLIEEAKKHSELMVFRL